MQNDLTNLTRYCILIIVGGEASPRAEADLSTGSAEPVDKLRLSASTRQGRLGNRHALQLRTYCRLQDSLSSWTYQ